MLTRKLTINDLEQFSQVSSTAYIHNADETTFEEDMEIFGTFADDGITLVSQIESDFRGLVYCGKRLTCLAVGGVASRPELRRLGGVRRTFDAVLQNGYEKGAVVSILHPFSIDYYRKFAYEPVFKYFHITTPFKTFEKIERFSGVTLATQKDFPALSEVYHSVAKKWNMMFTRDKESAFMLTPYQSMQYLYYINDGEDKGFVLITPHRPTFTINVNEIVFSNRSALLKLLGFLRTYEGNYNTVVFDKLPFASPVFNMLCDENKLMERKLLYGGAARIINLQKLLEETEYPREKGSFTILVNDAQLPQNDGIYTVEYENGKGTVSRAYTDKIDIESDILPLARIILGREGLAADELEFIPGITIKGDSNDFLRAFPRRTTLFYEDF